MTHTMKDSLINCFEAAIASGSQFVAVLIRMEGFPKDEVIINHIENAEAKLEYYLKTYDDELKLIFNNNIQIVNFTYADCFDTIQAELVD